MLCIAKYWRLGYDGIDLAYFSQVFWNTVRGRLFQQSIHPHLSLGDHAELAILLLAPFYAVFQDPRTLLILQTAALALGAWPAYLLAEDRFRGAAGRAARLAPLLFGLAWLASPLLQNVNFFEFHILAFSLTPLMFALLAYRRGRKRSFIVWSVLALLCREDVALVVMTIPLLAWIERRPRWWKIAPFVLGAAWFVAAMRLIGHFVPGGTYKYDVYYAWLGGSLPAVAVGALLHPLKVLGHMMTLANLEMIIGFLMPYAFLPLLGPAPLILAAGPAAQVFLGAPGGGELILQTHYSTLFIPGLTLAAIDGYAAFPALARRVTALVTAAEAEALSVALVAIATLYSACAFGPLPASVRLAIFPGERAAQARDALALASAVPPDAPVAASYALLPVLSSRERLYSTHYLFLGVTQFAQAPYPVPSDLRYTIFDLGDLLMYRASYRTTFWTAPQYPGGLARLEAAAGTPIGREGKFVLFERDAPAAMRPDAPPTPLEKPAVSGGLSVTGISMRTATAARGARVAEGVVRWSMAGDTDGLAVKIDLADGTGRSARSALVPLDSPAPATVQDGDAKITTAIVPLEGLDGTYMPTVSVVRWDGDVSLDDDRSTKIEIKKTEPLVSVDFGPISASRR